MWCAAPPCASCSYAARPRRRRRRRPLGGRPCCSHGRRSRDPCFDSAVALPWVNVTTEATRRRAKVPFDVTICFRLFSVGTLPLSAGQPRDNRGNRGARRRHVLGPLVRRSPASDIRRRRTPSVNAMPRAATLPLTCVVSRGASFQQRPSRFRCPAASAQMPPFRADSNGCGVGMLWSLTIDVGAFVTAAAAERPLL